MHPWDLTANFSLLFNFTISMPNLAMPIFNHTMPINNNTLSHPVSESNVEKMRDSSLVGKVCANITDNTTTLVLTVWSGDDNFVLYACRIIRMSASWLYGTNWYLLTSEFTSCCSSSSNDRMSIFPRKTRRLTYVAVKMYTIFPGSQYGCSSRKMSILFM